MSPVFIKTEKAILKRLRSNSKHTGKYADQWKVMNKKVQVIVTFFLMTLCCRWLSPRDIDTVSSAAGGCLLCQQPSTLILLVAKDVLDHTHEHTHMHEHRYTHWHSSSIRFYTALLFSFAASYSPHTVDPVCLTILITVLALVRLYALFLWYMLTEI